MKLTAAILVLSFCGPVLAQDPWKNIYSQHAWAERDKWQKADVLIRLLDVASGSTVADIGCHEGYMTFKLAKIVGDRGVVYAVDVVEAKLEKVEKRARESRLTQVKTIKGDYDNPRLPLNVLDGAIILDTYHEMDDHEEVLQHLKNSLKPGGHLVICEPISDSRRELSREAQEGKHELAMAYALADLKKAGFKIVYQKDSFIDRTREKGDKMWIVVAKK